MCNCTQYHKVLGLSVSQVHNYCINKIKEILTGFEIYISNRVIFDITVESGLDFLDKCVNKTKKIFYRTCKSVFFFIP